MLFKIKCLSVISKQEHPLGSVDQASQSSQVTATEASVLPSQDIEARAGADRTVDIFRSSRTSIDCIYKQYPEVSEACQAGSLSGLIDGSLFT